MLTIDSSVSAGAGLAEQNCLCCGVVIMAVRAGVHSDDILVAHGVRMGIGIIPALCPFGLGIIRRCLISFRVIMVGARSQSCYRNGRYFCVGS